MAGNADGGLATYLEEVAAGTPTPGGGSVAAVVGALAAALGEMVANLTLGRTKYADAESSLGPGRVRLTALRTALLEAAAADEAAYQSYRDAASLPRSSEREKSERTVAMQRALVTATDVPLGVAHSLHEVAKILQSMASDGNPHVRSDAAFGALLAEAALRGVLLNVRGNAVMLEDRELALAYVADADRLEEEGREAAQRAYQIAMDGAAERGSR